VGLPPENNMLLEHKLTSSIADQKREREASSAHHGPAKKKLKH